jgi:cell division protein FtsA
MNHCGLQVEEVYAEPFASATVSVTETERERGCVVADIGGGTTDGIVFQNSRPTALFTVNVAGNLMSKDLAIGLRTDIASAEKVKKRFGLSSDAAPVSVQLVDGGNRTVTPNDVGPILSARIREMGGLLVDCLRPYKGSLQGGIILTGGGAQVNGIENYLNELLRIPVKKHPPSLTEYSTGLTVNADLTTPYATVIGLLNLEISRICEMRLKENNYWPTRYLERFVNWIRELS